MVELVLSEDRTLIACYEKLLAQRNFDGFIEELLERVNNKPTNKKNAVSSSAVYGGGSGEGSLLSGTNQKAVIDILAK